MSIIIKMADNTYMYVCVIVLRDVAIIVIFVEDGMPIELYGYYQSYAFPK